MICHQHCMAKNLNLSRSILSVLLTVLAAGCSVLPTPGPAPSLYVLSPKNTYPAGLPTLSQQLVIAEPTANRALNTDRIALRPTPEEVKYFADVRWVNLAPRMIQTLLMESFENSGKIVAVGREAITLQPDYLLQSELREFQADYPPAGKPPSAVVRLNVKLIRQPEARIVASRTFSAAIPAEKDTKAAIIHAFDAALGKVLKRIVVWSLETIAQSSPPSN
jgi:cholesterol transport system auxiliary component